jgi:WD40 repeat protein
VRVSIDPGGVVAVASHADGSLRLTHLESGRVLWKAWGHGEMAAAAQISPDLERLISVSGDGCMFMWRLPEGLSDEIKAAAARVAAVRAPIAGDGAAAPPSRRPSAVDEGEEAAEGGHGGGAREEWESSAAGERARARARAEEEAARRRTLLGADAGPSPAEAASSAAAAGKEAAPAEADARTPPAHGSPQSELASAGPAAAAAAATHGSGGQTLKRVKAGRPLVPKARLPRWAASKVSPSPSPTKQPAARGFDADAFVSEAAAAAADEAGEAEEAPVVGGKWAQTIQRGAALFAAAGEQVRVRRGCGSLLRAR